MIAMVMAIDFNDGNRNSLAVNIYMPCDDWSTTSLNYDEFIKYLGLVDAIIKDHLNWKEQTARARSKGVRMLNMVRRNFTRGTTPMIRCEM